MPTSRYFFLSAITSIAIKIIIIGGPLHLGDIEDICSDATRLPCVICPWHKWTFNLLTGKQVRPEGKNCKINVYPVKIMSTGQLSIGFSSIDPQYFNPDNF